ncbi:DUF1490 family protein [Kineococcus sp. SYSU DK004]|uniref:DUF1490 family protein n=1 Tax=Kineococcus sp. SYSU DK004 TaxID=3383125 RepID=UPI003D7CE31E
MIPLAAPLGRLVLTAAASAGIVKAVSDGRGSAALRRVAVGGTKLGIRASRAAEVGVERTRLGAGDIVAQAYAELGETAPVRQAPAAGHDHQH